MKNSRTHDKPSEHFVASSVFISNTAVTASQCVGDNDDDEDDDDKGGDCDDDDDYGAYLCITPF